MMLNYEGDRYDWAAEGRKEFFLRDLLNKINLKINMEV